MMQCPKCNAGYESTDSFCMSCGAALQKKVEDGRIFLTQTDLAAIAGSNTYTQLSPLAAHYQGPAEKTKAPVMGPSVLDIILKPARAFFLMELTKGSFRQDVMLLGNSSCYRWEEDASGVNISKETSPREFIKRATAQLVQLNSHEDVSLMSIKKKSLKVLAAAFVLCRELSTINEAAAFVTLSHLGSFIGSAEGLEVEIKGLARQGFVGCIGDADPLIVLEKKGEELFLLLNEYDRYFIVQALTDGASDYPSLHFVLREGVFYLITNPAGGDDLVVRRVNSKGIASFVNWAWTTAVTAQ